MNKVAVRSIAIDLGAKNTGIYFANYQAGDPLERIKGDGKVYQLEKNNFTYLMTDRTANRHQRRGYDRRQMVKRLFRLIWQKNFKLPWDNDIQQTIGFLLNRRGFSFEANNEETTAGIRYRAEFFQEINKVLTNKKHTHNFLQNFCKLLDKRKFAPLTAGNLTNLIGHLSNLELKPLRWYFNDKRHINGDFWDKQRLDEIFRHWLINIWRVDSNNPDKTSDGKYSYKKLKDKIHHSTDMINFCLETDPNWTIPPYQDNNNRRPPRCQSLLLNTKYLNQKYPDWKKWLAELEKLAVEHLGDFVEQLAELKSGKDRSYFSDSPDKIKARVLHFILDRIKERDGLKLNEIFSHTKKLRQPQSTAHEKKEARVRLDKSLTDSKLSGKLLTKPNYRADTVFAEGSFLHFICKYYKFRQKARDGRIFIHPKYKKTNGKCKKTNQFADENLLLTFCNQKPRQKRYQLLGDLAGLLQVSQEKILESTSGNGGEDEQIVGWLESFKGLKLNAEKSSNMQKKFRGDLKREINKIIIKGQKKNDLFKLVERAKELVRELHSKLDKPLDRRLETDHASAVFLLAQLYNLAFKDRNGNANTCPICSVDNANRMQMNAGKAKAQRLPAISTRLIDGAVMRIARILSNAIVNDCWQGIYQELKAGKKVHIPIITESNRFEFEQGLANLKGNAIKGKSPDYFADKQHRVKKSSNGICPYTGNKLADDGEVDHIIPRASEYGVLNDEANLIYSSIKGNKSKGDQQYLLENLKPSYKHKQFGTDNDSKITQWIEEQLDDGSEEGFKFGRYFNFLNLTSDQQKAFRHALFLPQKNVLRAMIIRAIDHRKKNFVNGTQRYLAQTIADNFFRKANEIGKEKLLSFDFFGIDAWANSRGDGISDCRIRIEKTNDYIRSFAKSKNKEQQSYSHLIDAQIAFAMAAYSHKKDGSMHLAVADSSQPEDIFERICLVAKNNYNKDLKRRKPDEKFNQHRAFTRDTIYADNYLPVLLKNGKDGLVIKLGFTWQNSVEVSRQDCNYLEKLLDESLFKNIDIQLTLENLLDFLQKSNLFKNQPANQGYYYLTIDKQKLHTFWLQERGETGEFIDKKFFKFCWSTIGYRTEKKQIDKPEILQEILKDDRKFTVNKTIILPVKTQWQDCWSAWCAWQKDHPLQDDKINDEFNKFLLRHFKTTTPQISHQKFRQVYSLPIKSSGGKLLFRRKNWLGNFTDQIVDDSDSRNDGNKPCYPVITHEGMIGKNLSSWAKSKNTAKLSPDSYDNGDYIDPGRWYPIENSDLLNGLNMPCGVEKIEYRVDDNTRPSIRLEFSKDTIIDPSIIVGHPLCKARYPDDVKKNIEERKISHTSIEYKGSNFTSEMKRVLQVVIKKAQQ